MEKKYKISPLTWLLKDEASVKFHVKNNDYFGTIAAILSLIKQQTKKSTEFESTALNKIFNNLEKDLLYLQKNYQIKLKSKNKNKTPNGKLNNQ